MAQGKASVTAMAQFRRRGLAHRVVNPIALTRPGSAEGTPLDRDA